MCIRETEHPQKHVTRNRSRLEFAGHQEFQKPKRQTFSPYVCLDKSQMHTGNTFTLCPSQLKLKGRSRGLEVSIGKASPTLSDQTACAGSSSQLDSREEVDDAAACGYGWIPFTHDNLTCVKQLSGRLSWDKIHACCDHGGGATMLQISYKHINDFVETTFPLVSTFSGIRFVKEKYYLYEHGDRTQVELKSWQKSSIDLHENDKEKCLFKGDQMWFQDLCEVESTPICQKVLRPKPDLPVLTVHSERPDNSLYLGNTVRVSCVGVSHPLLWTDPFVSAETTTWVRQYIGRPVFCRMIYTSVRYVPVIDSLEQHPLTCCLDTEGNECVESKKFSVEKGYFSTPELTIHSLCFGNAHAFVLGESVTFDCAGTKYNDEPYFFRIINGDVMKEIFLYGNATLINWNTTSSHCRNKAEACFKVNTSVAIPVAPDLDRTQLACLPFDIPELTPANFVLSGNVSWVTISKEIRVFKNATSLEECGEGGDEDKLKLPRKIEPNVNAGVFNMIPLVGCLVICACAAVMCRRRAVEASHDGGGEEAHGKTRTPMPSSDVSLRTDLDPVMPQTSRASISSLATMSRTSSKLSTNIE
ncbi:hypothetical protein RRG08_035584 [Elysia crispata]|uniref:C-type lectin domain-containing protein n=1 Tax=Elysia crispata TaxID=231223 RepID=A0AAE1B5I0_9GAST|nr:hypothetical protein RRG08_035584 [Elysia crispata]